MSEIKTDQQVMDDSMKERAGITDSALKPNAATETTGVYQPNPLAEVLLSRALAIHKASAELIAFLEQANGSLTSTAVLKRVNDMSATETEFRFTGMSAIRELKSQEKQRLAAEIATRESSIEPS